MFFGFFKKKKTPKEQFLEGWQQLEAIERVILERRVKDLLIHIGPEPSSDTSYLMSIINTGGAGYKNLRFLYADILLWAESFSIDTTHMPQEIQYAPGEPLVINYLAPGEKVEVTLEGYGTHDRYDAPSRRFIHLEYELHNKKVTLADKKWCYAFVDLPSARDETDLPFDLMMLRNQKELLKKLSAE